MAALGWVVGGIIALLGGAIIWAKWGGGDATEAQSAGRGAEVVDLQRKVAELVEQLRAEWAENAKKVSQDAAKVTDVPSAIDFVTGVLDPRGKSTGAGSTD